MTATPKEDNGLRRMLGVQGLVLVAVLVGLLCGRTPLPHQDAIAQAVMTLFMNALRLVSLPIIFLAVSTTIMGMETLSELAELGRRVVTYTLLTTVLAATTALGLFVWVNPVAHATTLLHDQGAPPAQPSFVEHLVHIVPSSLFTPFIEGNVTAVLMMAVVFGIAMLGVPERAQVHRPLSAILAALLRIIRTITLAVPLVVWAGIVESFEALTHGQAAPGVLRYLGCVVAANLLQAFVVLPLLLKARGIAPFGAMRDFLPALSMAFVSKSSVATLPVALRCAEDVRRLSPRVTRFSFPMCTSINMNGCAAFILSTVLFVSISTGHVFHAPELIGWIFLSTLVALGNAGVPMGCYFLSCALLAAMDVPLNLMALILPFYSFIDMLETAVNVWSDATVAMLVDRDLTRVTDETAGTHTAR